MPLDSLSLMAQPPARKPPTAPIESRRPPRSEVLSAPLRDDPLAGSGYRAIERIGKGGFGEAWIAVHELIGHEVVCKLLHKRHLDDPRMLERVRLEAEAGARNPHPHLVNIFDLRHAADGRPFVVMEYIEGRTLHQVLRTDFNHGPLPLKMAIEIIRQILMALTQLHGAGVAHRDLKPANVMVLRQDPPLIKVIDLGLAKVFGNGAAGTPRPLAIPTASTELQGTPRYMAPEQIDKSDENPVDHRADLWAVGVMMMKLLTGRPPFADSKTMDDVLLATILETPETPSSLLSEPLPPGLDDVVLRALEKRPEDRFASAEAMLEAIAAIDLDAVRPTFKTVPIVPPTDVDEPALFESPKRTVPLPTATEPLAPAEASHGRTEGMPESALPADALRHPRGTLPLAAMAPKLAQELDARHYARAAAVRRELPWSVFFAALGAVALLCAAGALYILHWGGYL